MRKLNKLLFNLRIFSYILIFAFWASIAANFLANSGSNYLVGDAFEPAPSEQSVEGDATSDEGEASLLGN